MADSIASDDAPFLRRVDWLARYGVDARNLLRKAQTHLRQHTRLHGGRTVSAADDARGINIALVQRFKQAVARRVFANNADLDGAAAKTRDVGGGVGCSPGDIPARFQLQHRHRRFPAHARGGANDVFVQDEIADDQRA